MTDEQSQQDSTVPDVSSERVDWSWRRNAIQASLGLIVASVGAILGFAIAPAPRILGGIAGFVIAGGVGVFVVGAVYAFVPKQPAFRSLAEISTRYRSARRQFQICFAMIVVLLAIWPALIALGSAAAWIIWAAVIVVLYTNMALVHNQLSSWRCPRCDQEYGYPGLVRDLLSGGRYGCENCGVSMFVRGAKPPT